MTCIKPKSYSSKLHKSKTLLYSFLTMFEQSIIDYFWHKRIEVRLDKLDGATLNNMRREKNINHEDLLK